MFRNFFKVALRNIGREKGFSFINIAGLSVGITVCLLIGLFVWDEKQFDHFVPEGQNIYRVYDERTKPQGTETVATTPPMIATTLQKDYPETDKTARIIMTQYKPLVETKDKKIYEENGLFVDSSFFELFPFTFKFGTSRKALDDPNGIVLSKEMSQKYFGNEDPVGKTILLDKKSFQVKGVLADKLEKFHLKINFIIPLSFISLPQERLQNWTWHQFFTYVKLKDGTNMRLLQNKLQAFVKEKVHPITKPGGSTSIPFLQPLRDIHLYSANFKFDNAIRGNITYVKALMIIAVFILLIACFNFINLATAKSLQRAKEVGVRKSIGATGKQLMLQYTGETIFLSLISVLLSAIVTAVALPWLNQFTEKQISITVFTQPVFLLALLMLAFVVGVIAGIYPAFVLARFQPARVLKSSAVTDAKPGRLPLLRHGLVIIQFSLSALLIISAIIVFRQVKFLHNKDLGFNKDQVMFFPMRGDNMNNNYEAFKNELLQSPAVSSVSIGYGFPGDIFAGDNIIVPKNGENIAHPATQLLVDYDYVKTLNIQLAAGRDFSKDIRTDKDEAFIINETAVKQLGFGTPEKALGQKLLWHPWEATKEDSMKVGRVIGVVKDFNYKSLYDKLETAVLQIYPPAYWKVAVKVKATNLGNAINHVKKTWNAFSPEYPIEYKFMDENFEKMYKSEDKLQSLLSLFTGLAIFVGCLGLFGLAAYTAERRRKEVGVRKVLGASVTSVVLLLSKDFVKLVVISLLIASPIAFFLMNEWLADFPFRTEIRWWIFGFAGLLAVGIAVITVSMQALKAAMMNPVKSLRME
jgi:putative ABC transport system permease protein